MQDITLNDRIEVCTVAIDSINSQSRNSNEKSFIFAKTRQSNQSNFHYKDKYRSGGSRSGLLNRYVRCSYIPFIWCTLVGIWRSYFYSLFGICVPPNTLPSEYSKSCWTGILNRVVKVWRHLWRFWKVDINSKYFGATFNSETPEKSPPGKSIRESQGRTGEESRMMYVITYDLNQGIFHNYEGFLQEIRSLGPWSKYMDRTWIVATHVGLQEINDRLTKYLGQPDRLLIVKLEAGFYQGWLPPEVWDWINNLYPEYGHY